MYFLIKVENYALHMDTVRDIVGGEKNVVAAAEVGFDEKKMFFFAQTHSRLHKLKDRKEQTKLEGSLWVISNARVAS